MANVVKVHLPPRVTKKRLVTLPEDQWELIDNCASAMGMSRSTFLQVYFDVYAENMQSFAIGMLTGTQIYREQLAAKQNVTEAKNMLEKLGVKTYVKES